MLQFWKHALKSQRISLSYLEIFWHISTATFSQFFRDGQNTRHDSSGIISATRAPTSSGSFFSCSSVYCEQRTINQVLQQVSFGWNCSSLHHPALRRI